MDKRFTDIPATYGGAMDYRGMVKMRIAGTERAIQCFGWGPDVEKAVRTMYEQVDVIPDQE